jgi:hypothetical protein
MFDELDLERGPGRRPGADQAKGPSSAFSRSIDRNYAKHCGGPLAIVATLAFLYLVRVIGVRSFWWCAPGGLLCALVTASCGGELFSRAETSGGAPGGGLGALGGRAGGGLAAGRDAGGSGAAGAAARGGTAGAAGDTAGAAGDTAGAAQGDAGASAHGDAGAGNASGAVGCTALSGYEFGGHCYVDATVDSVTEQQAVAACTRLTVNGKGAGHLLVLDSAEEQSFVLRQFLVSFTDVSDAWLGLTCSELDQPDINACYCSGCTEAAVAEKQRSWSWLGGASSTFGWVNGNPNAGYRCAALAYNPETTIWGWVDRPCDKVSVAGIAGHSHDYRTLCELEP